MGSLAACGGGPTKPKADPTTSTTSGTLAPTTTVSEDLLTGQQAFAAFQNAFGVIAQVAGTPTDVSTDPRLSEVLANPFLLEVVQQINLYRLHDQVVKGSYSFTNFHLDSVTPDGRVIFTDCQINGQSVYDVKTGAVVGNPGTTKIPEQVVAYRTSPTAPFKIADDNQGPATAGARNACA